MIYWLGIWGNNMQSKNPQVWERGGTYYGEIVRVDEHNSTFWVKLQPKENVIPVQFSIKDLAFLQERLRRLNPRSRVVGWSGDALYQWEEMTYTRSVVSTFRTLATILHG